MHLYDKISHPAAFLVFLLTSRIYQLIPAFIISAAMVIVFSLLTKKSCCRLKPDVA